MEYILIYFAVIYWIFILTKAHHEKRMRYWRSKEREHLGRYYVECMESWYNLQIKQFEESK